MPIRVEEVEGILLVHVMDTYGAAEVAAVMRVLEAFENKAGPVPDRIMDLSAVESFEINFGSLSVVADERRAKTYRNSYRSAFVASKPAQMGFARMYQTLAQNDSVEFAIVQTVEAALAWIRRVK